MFLQVLMTFFASLESGGIGDVFFLDRDINNDFFLLDLWIEEFDRQLQ